MTTKAEVVTGHLSGDYWQTVSELHRSIECARWIMTKDSVRGVAKHLVRTGVAVMEMRYGHVPSGRSGRPYSRRKVMMFRLKGS